MGKRGYDAETGNPGLQRFLVKQYVTRPDILVDNVLSMQRCQRFRE